MGIEQLATFATPPTDENCLYQVNQGCTFLAFSPPDGNLICTIYPTPSAPSLQPWRNSSHGLEQKLKLSHHLKHFWPNSFREGAVLLFMEVENHCYYELRTCACPYSVLWERKKMASVSNACQAEGTVWACVLMRHPNKISKPGTEISVTSKGIQDSENLKMSLLNKETWGLERT